ncbi:UNVERIFIED_CONTAM: putative Ca2+/H+ antiporter (TMEM165/GDT1 family) [Acetivibrio alkalicellulosi]
MIQEILKAFFLIFIAEMGDKTQILAMAFATRFPVKKVLLGVFIGVLLNHGLAVVLGKYISSFIPGNSIQIVAGFAFVGFALWNLKIDSKEDEEGEKKYKYSPVLTVALAFFIGELGDKTQLTAITLATEASYPLAMLSGTVLAMIATCSLGILVGKQLGDKVPEFNIKLISASVFMLFGVIKLYQNVPKNYLNIHNTFVFIVIISIITLVLLRSMVVEKRKGFKSKFKRMSKELYEYYHHVGKSAEKICLGSEKCGKCQMDECMIGYIKSLVKNALEGEIIKQKTFIHEKKVVNKNYDKGQVMECLKMTLRLIRSRDTCQKDNSINQIRINLERILFGKSVGEINDWENYSKSLYSIDKVIAKRILE